MKKRRKIKIKLWILSIGILILVGMVTSLILHENTKKAIKEIIIIEAGAKKVDISQFSSSKRIQKQAILLKGPSIEELSKPDIYDAELMVGKITYKSSVKVEDTKPPQATVLNKIIDQGETIEADEFLSDILDASPISISYKDDIDYGQLGEQEVEIIVKDTSNNSSNFKTKLFIIDNLKGAASPVIGVDITPPIIKGLEDKIICVGDSISYRKGVVVSDERSSRVDLIIDSSGVNLLKEGIYEVVYTAIDEAGNRTKATSKIDVRPEGSDLDTEAEVLDLVDQILEEIIKPDMSQEDQAWEVFKWVRRNVSYVGDSDKSSVFKEAKRGLRQGVGDCFTFYALSEVMLTRLGIENMRVTREGGRTEHYWSLVDCGYGFYHYDSTPQSNNYYSFMLTDEETRQRGKVYYRHDKSNLPEVATEKRPRR